MATDALTVSQLLSSSVNKQALTIDPHRQRVRPTHDAEVESSCMGMRSYTTMIP